MLNSCRRFALLAAALLMVVGISTLMGWALHVEVLRSLVVSLVPMNPATAVAFLLAGAALVAQEREHRRVALMCALVVAAAGVLRLAAYANPSIFDFGIDRLLFSGQLNGSHIAPNTAFNFVLTGFALVLMALDVGVVAVHALALLSMSTVFVVLMGYLYQVPLIGLPGQIPMALNSALSFLVLALAILALSAAHGPVSVVVSQRPGGRVARRLLPLGAILPVAFGGFSLFGEHRGWFNNGFGTALLVVLSAFCAQAVVLLTAGSLNRGDAELERLLTVDVLTGLLNRRAINELLGIEAAKALRYHVPLSAAMIDLDNFKAINDTHGHAAGDLVLQTVGAVFKEALRGPDLAGRYGGEEFIAVLPNTELEGAMVMAERLRQRIADTKITLPSGKELTVTCSIGIAQLMRDDHPHPEQTLARADKALYRAKHAGRNRVLAAEDGGIQSA